MKFPRIVAIPGDSMRSVQALAEQTGKAMSGNVSFGLSNTDPGKNIQCWLAQGIVTPVAANTDFAVPHNLPYIPILYFVGAKSATCDIYTGAGTWTKATTVQGNIFLRCTVSAVTISLLII